ncbi:MAG: zf-HC2 domain-containing protein [Bacteroidota bacterium]|jgi:predicted anti-sigma-YlaC factor YlaD
MNCQTGKEYISQLLDNELESEFLQPLFQHLAECSECRSFYTRTRSIQKTLGHLPNHELPELVDQKFAVLAIGKEKRTLMNRKITIPVPSAMLSGVFVFMLSILFVFFIRNLQSNFQYVDQKFEMNYTRPTPSTLQMPQYN